MNAKTKPKQSLFRGDKWGVFAGANGYYCAAMAADGVSHYQPANQGYGWDEETRRDCNRAARERENSLEVSP